MGAGGGPDGTEGADPEEKTYGGSGKPPDGDGRGVDSAGNPAGRGAGRGGTGEVAGAVAGQRSVQRSVQLLGRI